jgi:hypothetical protein
LSCCDKSIAPARDGFNKVWRACVVVQCLAQAVDRFIEGLIEVDKSGSPDMFLQLFTGDDFTRALGKHDENTEGLLLQPNGHPMFT